MVDKKIHLLDDLQSLLEKQIELVKQGNISEMEPLRKRADSLINKIAKEGSLELAEFENRREKLQKSYEELCLALTAQKADVSEKLKRVRKGRKTVETYRRNI